jgi:hypothetical protein
MLPVPAMTTAVYNFKGGVVGQPGTQGIPAPTPEVPFNRDISAWPFPSGYSNSGAMPAVWYPSLYYMSTLEIPGAEPITGGMRVESDNQLPVPARLPSGASAILSRPPQFLGQRQVTARKAFPRWPDWLPRPGFGS